MPADTPDRDEDLPELLDDLETTLADLRTELQQETGPDRGRSPSRRPGRDRSPGRNLPRPPSVSDLLEFTEQYTLPTLISTLEATIRALELLRGTLRLVNPDGGAYEAPAGGRDASSVSRLGSGAAGVGREAVSGVERALSELEAALAASDLPEDRASSELLGEARDLSAEVRERLERTQGADNGARRDRRDETGDSGRRPGAESDRETGGVRIEVTDGDSAGDTDATGNGRSDDDTPEVDVEAELESIRHEVRGAEGADGDDDPGQGADSASGAEHSGDVSDGADDAGTTVSERADSDSDDGDDTDVDTGPAA